MAEGISKSFELSLLTSNRPIVKLLVEPTSSIREVKQLVEDKEGFPCACQHLILDTKRLEDDYTLSYYGISKESVLYLLLETRGRGDRSSPRGAGYTVFVKTETRPLVFLYVRSIDHLKYLICSECNVLPDRMRLVHAGRVLNDVKYCHSEASNELVKMVILHEVHIKMIIDKQFSVLIGKQDTVEMLKSWIKISLGINFQDQTLLYENQQLEDHMQLSHYNIVEGSTLWLLLGRPRTQYLKMNLTTLTQPKDIFPRSSASPGSEYIAYAADGTEFAQFERRISGHSVARAATGSFEAQSSRPPRYLAASYPITEAEVQSYELDSAIFSQPKAVEQVAAEEMIETGVHATYSEMVEDKYNLRGVEVCGETTFEVVGGKAQTLKWDDYGFQLEVPYGALPAGTTASVTVKAILDGQFALPEGSQLVSVVYWIACNEVFLKEVALVIQHCAIIRSKKDLPNFTFIIAKCNQRQLPYQFKKKEGDFSPHSHYAIIKLKSFSFIGIVWEWVTSWFNLECSYRALMNIKRCKRDGSIFFTICKDLLAVLQVVKQTMDDPLEQVIEFDDDCIILSVRCHPPQKVCGWQLQATTFPMFKQEEVNRSVPVPPCKITVSWKGSAKYQQPVDLNHPIKLKGAKQPRNVFVIIWPVTPAVKPQPSHAPTLLHQSIPVPKVTDEVLGSKPTLKELLCVKYSDDSGDSNELRLIDRIAPVWERIGVGLNFEYSQLKVYKKDKTDSTDCTMSMLSDWLEHEPVTWDNLLQALDTANEVKTHEKLRAFLSTR